uniref:Uncharacterized protein n=1 Tax=Arion vulgaris TaxID=1028688 RepID=A0A0B7AEE5_9EUPU
METLPVILENSDESAYKRVTVLGTMNVSLALVDVLQDVLLGSMERCVICFANLALMDWGVRTLAACSVLISTLIRDHVITLTVHVYVDV